MIKNKLKDFTISFETFFQNHEKGSELFSMLMEKRFKKTQIDVVYDDFVRWERRGLLFVQGEDTKSAQRLYSYIDYVWFKIVERLRLFGFSYESIINYKAILFERLSIGMFYEHYDKMNDSERNKFAKEDLQLIIENRDKHDKESELNFGYFEILLANIIFNEDQVSLLFFPDSSKEIIPISVDVMRQTRENMQLFEFTKFFGKTHASISLNEIIRKFIIRSKKSHKKSRLDFYNILTEEEYSLLKYIRKHTKDVKSITIRFMNNKMNLMEVEKTKKVNIESKLLEHINNGDYSDIVIKTVDGKIVDFKKTDKIKL